MPRFRFRLSQLFLVVLIVCMVIGIALALPVGPRELFLALSALFAGCSLFSVQIRKVLLSLAVVAGVYCAATYLAGYSRHNWAYLVLTLPIHVAVVFDPELWPVVFYQDVPAVRPTVSLVVWWGIAFVVATSLLLSRASIRRRQRHHRELAN